MTLRGRFERALSLHYAETRARLRKPLRLVADAPQLALLPAPTPPLAPDRSQDETPDPLIARPIACQFIFAHVCAFYAVTMIDLVSARKLAPIAQPRQVAMYLARTLTLKSLPEIGEALGKRDHTTVLRGVRRIAGRLPDDPILAQEVAELTARITARQQPRSQHDMDLDRR